jgi:hypothetical protein
LGYEDSATGTMVRTGTGVIFPVMEPIANGPWIRLLASLWDSMIFHGVTEL